MAPLFSDFTWTDNELANPHANPDKAQRVKAMFSAIAPSYDLNNRLHSLGFDQAWRRAAVKASHLKVGDIVLDVACGTGDLSLAFARSSAGAVLGMDFTFAMLVLAQQKSPAGLPNAPTYHAADAMRLPLADRSVDVVSIAFGLRNVADPALAAREFYRVLRPGGRLVILEFSLPGNPVLRWFYQLYFNRLMPWTATLISGDRSGAYKYLPKSVDKFLSPEATVRLIHDTGFVDASARPLSLGIAVIYRGAKPD